MGWFPKFSPSGRHVMRGNVTLTVDGVSVAGDAISGAWLSEDVILYRQHSTGTLRRLAAGMDEDYGPVCHQVVAGGGFWALWHEWGAAADRVPFVATSDGRRFLGFGGGLFPLAMSPGGVLVMPRHRDGVLCIVPPHSTTPVALAEGRLPRCGARSVVWEYGTGRISHANLDSRLPLDVTVPGEQCYGPVLVDGPGEEWVLTHTASERLLLFPVGSHDGYVVAEGVTEYPDAAWTPAGVRVAWSRQGEPLEALVDLSQPRVSLVRQPPVWHPDGTPVDTLPFMVPTFTGTLRSDDGQTLQTVRTGPREVTCLKGSPERQERWTWDDTAVYLTYDASDGRDGRPWRVTPTPVWCRRMAQVGEAVAAPDAVLVRRMLTGGAEAHPFPVRTTVAALGEHIDLGALGRCRVLVTTWEPGWPTSGYAEHHWWAIRESDGLRWGRVRYEEHRSGQLERAFAFHEPLPDVQLVPAPPLAIPGPPDTPDTPDPPDAPETPAHPTMQSPPRDQILDCLTWLRDEVYPGLVGHALDDEGIAAWLVDTYLVDGRLRRGLEHEPAKHHTYAAIERVVRPPAPPPVGERQPAPPLKASGRLLVTADGQPADWREASAFMLLARYLKGEDIGPTLDWWAAHGATALRVFASIGHPSFWEARGWLLTPRTMGLYAGMRHVTQMAADRGLWLRWTLIADMPYTMPTQREQERHVENCASALAGLPVVVEIANEPTMNGYRDDWANDLASLAAHAVSLPVVALGPEHGSTGHLATADRPPATLVTFHAERQTGESGWAWVRRLGEYGVVLHGKRPVLSGEPINAGDKGAGGDYQADPAIWFCYGALSRVVPSHGYAPTFHFDDGLWALVPTGATLACWEAFQAGCEAVPLAARLGAWVNGHHDGAPWRGYSQTDPPSDHRPSRIYGRLVDGGYVGVSIREPKGWSWADRRYPVERVARVEGERFDGSVWRG